MGKDLRPLTGFGENNTLGDVSRTFKVASAHTQAALETPATSFYLWTQPLTFVMS